MDSAGPALAALCGAGSDKRPGPAAPPGALALGPSNRWYSGEEAAVPEEEARHWA